MENNVYVQEELTLGEIFKILWRKVKLLLLVLLIGVVAGGGFGVLTTFSEKYYGTAMEFYVNPTKEGAQVEGNSEYGVYGTYSRPVMDNIVRLLASESFAEQLLLNEKGMPKFYDEKPSEALEEAVTKAEPYKIAEINAKKVLNDARIATVKAQVAYSEREEEWEIEKAVNGADESEKTAFFEDVTKDLVNARLTEKNAENDFKKAYEDAKEFTEEVYKLYRETAIYQKYISVIKNSVSYNYYKDKDFDSVDSLAKSFIYVEISVLGDEEFAKVLYEQLLVVLPEYVMEKMPVPTGFSGTSCQRITRMDQVKRTNNGHVIKSAIKYALILGVVSLGIACVTVVIIERSRKKTEDSASHPSKE